MRNAFAGEVFRLAKEDERVILLSGDIGNRLFDNFKTLGGSRFFNCGVAEANMMGVAAGMALCGLRPFVYTITPFTTTRCFEQIRIDVCYHNAPVIIVGTGSGLSYAELGPTHHSLEDMAILRTLPGIRVYAPCDSTELKLILRLALADSSPAYIRIGKKGERDIHDFAPDLKIGEAIVTRPGEDVAILSAGNMMDTSLKAAEILSEVNISTEVVSFPTIKPLDTRYLEAASQKFKIIITVEEHGLIGGFGAAVAEWRSDANSNIRHVRFGTGDKFMHQVGSQSYARKLFGITPENIASHIKNQFALERLK